MSAIVMRPCPFCGGPPVLLCQDPIDPEPYVFCHECGAQGPVADPIFIPGGHLMSLVQLRVEACRLWNLSDQRHADLYSPTRATIDVASGERIHHERG